MRAGDYLRALETLPYVSLRDLLGSEPALILTPHPDDESLGCGGLIAEACAHGVPPLVAILTDGSASHPGSFTYPPKRLAALRAAEVGKATALLGVPLGNLFHLNFPDGSLPAHVDEAVAQLAACAANCGTIIGPWSYDPHCDHEAAAQISARLAEQLDLPLLSYPVWGWLLPKDAEIAETRRRGWRLDISNHLSAKRGAIAAHASQRGEVIRDSPDGFLLPSALLSVFERPFEVFISA